MGATEASAMTVIAGPCVIEDEGLVTEVAEELARQLAGLPLRFYFKASFDKANRTSVKSYRGPGLSAGLSILGRLKSRTGLALLTDFHSADHAEPVAEVVDYLQVPAFLCRQTDIVTAGATAALRHGRRLNVKKGPFLAPWDVGHIVDKARSVAGEPPPSDWLTITERGTSFGYNALVVDMFSFRCIAALGVPVIHDATHSIQAPGAGGDGSVTGGDRQRLEPLARAAMAAGASGLFFECHPRPAEARSDAANALPLAHAGDFVRQLLAIRALVAGQPYLIR